ncbi:MAG: dockerin type I repeat-containing protein [Bacteroidaceae bacterium]|nr:dockerin type I repeat-containing protein [Bacteroidaceae bacterium]
MKKICLCLIGLLLSLIAQGQTDVTSKITNPSFEDGTTGWTVARVQTQNNDAMSTYKAGNTYVERWTPSPGLIGCASVKQTVSGLSNGVYRLTAAAMNTAQNNIQVGAWIVGNGLRTAVSTLNTYTLDFFVTDGTAEIGFVADGASGNWVGCDNFQLSYLGNNSNNIKSAGNTVKNYANSLISTYGSDTKYSSLISTLTTAINGGNLTNVANAAKAVVEGERAYRLRHPSGSAPTVTTNKRHARGSIWAFGRLSSTGSDVVEEGFCWSTSPNPTINDNHTTDWLDSNGKVIWMQGLTPGTMYYVRAYAMTKDYAVGYGDVIKVPTLPQGSIHWSYGNEGDDETNNRITNAATKAFDQYWSNLTQLTTFYPSLHYASGTPTADCSYGGWTRIGPNVSYQQAGTVMHEALHGVGVGTHWMWTNDRGDFNRNQYPVWDVLRFWNNDETATLSGDGQHLWPYGINGAHEDSGTDQLYIGNSLICEALGEGGLPLTDSQWLLPYYAYPQDDNTKYYFKCEDENYGLLTSYLVENASGNLEWKELTASQAQQASNKAAWYMTFDASKQKYHIKNANTGHYIRYSSSDAVNGFTTGSKATDIQMKKCRVDVNVGSLTYQGYYLLDYDSKQSMEAKRNGSVGSVVFSIWDNATTQRWVIIPEGELAAFENEATNIEPDTPIKPELVNNGFTQITSLPADYRPYFFVLYDHDLDLAMTIKDGNHQGAFKAMWYDKDTYPMTDKKALWTIDSYTQDGTDYQILANATNPDFMFQTEWNAPWNYRCSDNGGNGDLYWGRTTFAYLPDGYWTIQNGVYPENGYLGPWDCVFTDDAETALNKTDANVGNFDIFTILRGDYVKRFDAGVSDATFNNPLDISYVLENPGGERRSPVGWTIEGASWGAQGNDALAGKVGGYFLEIWNTSGVGSSDIYQEIQGLPDGYYRFSAVAMVNAEGQTLNLYANDRKEATPNANEGTRTDVIVRVSDGKLRVGVKAEGITSNWIAFDDAKLEYLGLSIPGDINYDGLISIADVTALVNIILGKDNNKPYQYNHDAADVNTDGTISIADVTALVNIILGKEMNNE